jgi:hypothetical protein
VTPTWTCENIWPFLLTVGQGERAIMISLAVSDGKP